MTGSLKGKKVLFIAPRFFGYEKDVFNELKRRGAEVDYVFDRPFDSSIMKAVTRFRREWMIKAADRFYRNELKKRGNKTYDLIFVISGQTLSEKTLRAWRKTYTNAQFLLYMWDSFGNRRWGIDNLQYFDQCLSFDRNDAAKYGMDFRALFFLPGFEQNKEQTIEYDLSFIGTAHTDRYALVSKIKQELGNEAKTFWYLFLQEKWVFWVYKLTNSAFKNARISEFKFTALSKETVQNIFSKSRVLLDIEHPKQTGLTMRTIETLGARKKLITTNVDIKKYDFYSPLNICVVDRKSPHIPHSFLQTAYVDIPQKIYDSYTLDGWMDEILENIQL